MSHDSKAAAQHTREMEEYNLRALHGEFSDPIPDDVVCPRTTKRCDDIRCRMRACLDEAMGT